MSIELQTTVIFRFPIINYDFIIKSSDFSWFSGPFLKIGSSQILPRSSRQTYWHYVLLTVIQTHILKYIFFRFSWYLKTELWRLRSGHSLYDLFWTHLGTNLRVWLIHFGTLNRTSQKVKLSCRLPLICTSINEYSMTPKPKKSLVWENRRYSRYSLS